MDPHDTRTSAEPVDALVVVDMQRGLLDGPAAVTGAAAVTAAVRGILDRARSSGALVVHLQNDGPVGGPDEPHTPGWDCPLAGPTELVIRKSTDDGFDGTVLGEVLDGARARRLAMVGVLSEMCVSATARTALRRGYSVVLPHDAHGTYDLDDIPAAIVSRVAEHALGDQVELVASADEVHFRTPPS